MGVAMTRCPQQTDSEALGLDTPCAGCNYNLRGLPVFANCPECGMPVAQSSPECALVCANPRWLARVSLGLTLLVWGCLLWVAAMVAIGVILLTANNVPGQWWLHLPCASSWVGAMLWGIWHACWVYYAVAIVLVTTPEPRLRFEESAISLRRVLRVAAVVLMPLTTVPLSRILGLNSIRWLDWGSWNRLSDIGGIAVCLLLGLYLSGFGRRMSQRRMGRRTLLITAAFTSAMCGMVLTSVLADVTGRSVADVPSPLSVIYTVFGLGSALCALMYIGVVIEYMRAFASARRLMEAHKVRGPDGSSLR